MSSAISFNLNQSKILSSGNGLNESTYALESLENILITSILSFSQDVYETIFLGIFQTRIIGKRIKDEQTIY